MLFVSIRNSFRGQLFLPDLNWPELYDLDEKTCPEKKRGVRVALDYRLQLSFFLSSLQLTLRSKSCKSEYCWAA